MGQARKQYLIVSLPSHGTDWLSPILARHGGLRYYDKEYFNPICNRQHGARLESAFGCELVSCYRNIGVPWDRQIETLESLYRETWERDAFDMTKEIYSAAKVGWFARHFQVVMLYREAASVFPPSRLRVYAWYDAIYNALAEGGHITHRGWDLAERAAIAHQASWAMLREAASQYGIPILDYDQLCTAPPDRIPEMLSVGWIAKAVNVQQAAAEVLATRRHIVKA
jgi:hypothetical protein